jgi:alpha-glucosidase
LRGNIILYYGEELGLDQVEIPFDRLQDPEAIANWPLTLSRDGARTPMPWDAGSNHLGFGSGDPWLPTGPSHAARAVSRQAGDATSLLNLTRELLAMRNGQRAMRWGNLTCIDTAEKDRGGDDVLAFTRILDGECVTCIFNLTENTAAWPKTVKPTGAVLTNINGAVAGDPLPPFGAVIVRG